MLPQAVYLIALYDWQFKKGAGKAEILAQLLPLTLSSAPFSKRDT